MRRSGIWVILAVFTVLAASTVPVSSASASSDRVLVDFGNGEYAWYDVPSADTYAEILSSCRTDVVFDGGVPTVDGYGPKQVTGEKNVSVEWKIYSWDGVRWVFSGTDFSAAYSGGTVAFGYYADPSVRPTVTPDEPVAWTMLGGSSSASGHSESSGTDDPALPVEWFVTYNTGYVDSGLVVAGGYLYHTTGGVYGAHDGTEDAYVYCLDRYTGEKVWEYHGKKGAGYEVSTPVVVDGHLVVSSTDGYLRVFDRYTGAVEDEVLLEYKPPMDSDGNIVWDGRVFTTGATTPVYDSGCLYFGTADGRVCCYSLSGTGKLAEVWVYEPPSGYHLDGDGKRIYDGSRGCFYFHAPTIANIGGENMLYIGNYEGYIFAIRADDGSSVWSERLIDLRADNKSQPGTPGSVASVSVSPDGSKLVVACTDGALFSSVGYLIGLDPLTGTVLKRSDGSEWKLNGLFTPPAQDEDSFYCYLSPLSDGSSVFRYTDGRECEGRNAILKFDWNGDVVWVSQDYQMIKGQLTVADGRVYATDYSAGKFWPTGGGVTSLDAGTGEQIWRIQLKPFTADSYSMVPVTVVDGKLYVANDLGAVYCISETAGKGTDEEHLEMLQTVGFRHWSWVVLLGVVVVAAIVARRLY